MKNYFAAAAVTGMLLFTATSQAVVINEFMYNTDGGNFFIELYNRSGRQIDISGWRVWKSQADASEWESAPIVTIPNNVSMAIDGYYLIASQDVFVIAPDVEADFVLEDPMVTGKVEGIRLTDHRGDAMTGGNTDTVLYGPAGANPTGQMVDDLGLQDANRIVPVNALQLPGGGTVNISEMRGAGARREADDGQLGDGSDGNGADTNNSAQDFWGFETGGASPQSNTTPVTLSIFSAN